MRCPQCHNEIQPEWRFCRSCGAQLDEPATMSAPPDPDRTAPVPAEPAADTPTMVASVPSSPDFPGPSADGPSSDIETAEVPPVAGPESTLDQTPNIVAGPGQTMTTSSVQTTPPRQRRTSNWAIVGWAVAVFALASATGLLVSRSSLSSKLSSTRAELASRRTELDATSKKLEDSEAHARDLDEQVASLNERVTSLSADNQQIQADLEDAQEENSSLEKKVDACQDVIKISYDVYVSGDYSDAQIARFTTKIINCYGRFPDFLT